MNDTVLANALSALTITCSDATAYNTEVLKYRTLKLVLEAAKKIESKNVNIRKAVSGLIVCDYLKIEGVDDSLLLGIEDPRKVELSYSEKKEFRLQLTKSLKKEYLPTIKHIQEIKNNIPNFRENPIEDIKKLTEKSVTRGNLTIQQLEKNNEKCNLLKLCVELRFGNNFVNELEVLGEKYNIIQSKIGVRNSFVLKCFFSNSSGSQNAFKQLESFIDEKLKENNLI